MATVINVDVNGVGGGVVDALVRLDEFSDAAYSVGAINNSSASPDPTRWLNARAWHYDTFREMMSNGQIDLDYEDNELREELISQTYKFSSRGSIQMTSKDEMKRSGMSSPDNLDAAILCTIDMERFSGLQPGDVIMGVEELFDEHAFYTDTYW
jgi:hypothetical protein